MTDTAGLKDLMYRKGITQRDIAKALGVAENTVYRKINNYNEFTQSQIRLITKLLGLTSEEEDRIFFTD